MLSEKMKVWALEYEAQGEQRGMQQGMQQGMQKGEALFLQKVLIKRFGAIPLDILARISAASQEQVEAWFDQAFEAEGYEDLFGPTTH